MSNSGGNGGGTSAPVYVVPWKLRKPTDAPAAGLVLYWFPATVDEMKNSSLRQSRILSVYASQCVSMEWADGKTANADKLMGDSKLPVAVLAKPDGTPISRLENANGKLKVADVEKLVDTEMKQRKAAVTGQFKRGRGQGESRRQRRCDCGI
jgi:hypothetical protein